MGREMVDFFVTKLEFGGVAYIENLILIVCRMPCIIIIQEYMYELSEVNMREDILNYLCKEVEHRCKLPTNHFGMGCFYHIQAVVKNAEILADSYNADKEAVLIAAWLHDIASITDYSLYEDHHIHGAEMAGDILHKFNYSPDKIKLVQQCIRSHRGSILNSRVTVEELCVTDADAISHFDNVPSLLYLAYVNKKMDIKEGREFVRNKLIRSYEKLSDKSKILYKTKFDQVMNVLN